MTQRDRNAGTRDAARQKSGSKALEPKMQEDLPSTASASRQMQQRAGASSQQGGGRVGSHQGAGQGESGEARGETHPGQLGYSQGGGAHDNWGAFEGDQQRQSPGYGQEEPWQHHHDADYLRWREEHLRQLDEEYATWRRDRYGKFSEEFSQWRDSRQGMARDAASSPQRTPESDDKIGSEDRRTSLHGKLK